MPADEDEMPTDTERAYQFINDAIIPQFIEHFSRKQRDYTGGPAFMFLGLKGQFSDINRKFWKLYRAMWEGQELEDEDLSEVLYDLMGHCALSIYCHEKERGIIS